LTTESRIVPTETVETAELTNSPSKPADPKQAGEATDAKEAKEAKEPTDEKETVAAGTTASPRANAGVPSKTTITKTMQTTFHFCYDKAIASGYGHGKTFAPECGATSAQSSGSYHILPIVRSPYAVFQYYGRLLETGTANRVVLIDANTARLPTHDSLIFNVAKGEDAGGCFASAHHEGDTYCVPNTGSNNTKEIFILLNTLVNLSTSRDALPTTTTVQLSN